MTRLCRLSTIQYSPCSLSGWQDGGMEPEELAGAIKRLTEWAEEHAPRPESAVRRRVGSDLGGGPAEGPIVARAPAGLDRPNIQVAVDAWCRGREVEVVGLPVMQGYRAG